MNEVWKPMHGYETKYLVSNLGNVYSIPKQKVLNKHTDRQGYIYVKLYDKKEIQRNVHRIVATTYLPNPQLKTQVHHIDRDRSNNCVENLMWVDDKEHKMLHGENL